MQREGSKFLYLKSKFGNIMSQDDRGEKKPTATVIEVNGLSLCQEDNEGERLRPTEENTCLLEWGAVLSANQSLLLVNISPGLPQH